MASGKALAVDQYAVVRPRAMAGLTAEVAKRLKMSVGVEAEWVLK